MVRFVEGRLLGEKVDPLTKWKWMMRANGR